MTTSTDNLSIIDLLEKLADGQLSQEDLQHLESSERSNPRLTKCLHQLWERQELIVQQNEAFAAGHFSLFLSGNRKTDRVLQSYENLSIALSAVNEKLNAIAHGCWDQEGDSSQPVLFRYPLSQIFEHCKVLLRETEKIAEHYYAAPSTPRSDFDTIAITLFNLHQTLTMVSTVCGALAEGHLSTRILVKNPHDQLAIAVNKMADHLESALNAKNTAHHQLLESTQLLIQTEKMSALGTFAAGTAHELLNPLMGILNYLQYINNHYLDQEKCLPLVEKAEHETVRCVSIIRDLLAYSHIDPQAVFEKHPPQMIINRALQLIDHRLTHDKINTSLRFSENARPVKAQFNKLLQVFINLFLNAADSMRNTVHRTLTIDEYYESDYAVIRITDSGCGMSQNILEKIFDPFFTTKATGEGTGLGLPIVRGIVEDHAGQIECSSTPGKGTCFTLRIPLAESTL